ncbi:hypothetical protein KSP40_PGU004218 [Platanthera guangdongensis]|uniref:Secreted protein n=1 Tax=Platanthera guangdongensis TaxID=2320717 RepID=A0ABR2LSK6_9ASPA
MASSPVFSALSLSAVVIFCGDVCEEEEKAEAPGLWPQAQNEKVGAEMRRTGLPLERKILIIWCYFDFFGATNIDTWPANINAHFFCLFEQAMAPQDSCPTMPVVCVYIGGVRDGVCGACDKSQILHFTIAIVNRNP